jgi:polysaccharide biosynthesis transport protein
MNENHPGNPPPMFKLGDILYVVFRHKWKILIISALGITAACLFPFTVPHLYQSEAKILIKYVLESKSATQIANNDSQVRAVDSQGESVINDQLQLLSSLDLARDVARIVGPDKIIGKTGGSTNIEVAAAAIRANLLTDVPKGSTVIRIVFQHPDRELVQPILKQIIESYLDMHIRIHLKGGELDGFLSEETDNFRNRLARTEELLRQAKAKANIISLEDSKKGFSEQMGRIQGEILEAKAQLEEGRTASAEIAKLLNTKPVLATNQVGVSNNVAVSTEKEGEYKRVCRLLESLRKKEDEMLTYLTPESSGVKDVEARIAENEKLKQQMEEKNPGLLATKTWERTASAADLAAGPRADLITQSARVAALEAKIKVLTEQLATIHKEATNLAAVESSITELEREYALDLARYKTFADSREQTRMAGDMGPGKISNISKIQEASPPFLAATKLLKVMGLILFGSIGGAFALAFAIEYYLDPSLKRPAEVEAKLGVPLFMSIPLMRQNGNSHALKPGGMVPLLSEKNNGNPNGDKASPPVANGQQTAEGGFAAVPGSALDSGVALWDSRHAMRPFSDALRDRLINFFEAKNMTHKPKLVAVTSCRQGSGVSTIAAGLAASLSETGDGNVLLVDMNQQEGAAHQFRRGDLACLDDALEVEKRDSAMVQDNLYVVAESSTGDNLPRALPKRFKNIVPRLKASDFDYIIFDLPPVTQISMTPRLSRFMDVVLMVIESETTDKEVLKRSITLLHESQRNIGTVLNKRRSYVPKWLQQEF